MRRFTRHVLVMGIGVGAMAAVSLTHADVTIEQTSAMNAGGLNINLTNTERVSADKQRRDTVTHCQGFMAMFCGNLQTGSIVRLDKQLEWQLQPKKQEYTERPFPTAEQRAQAQQQLQATLDEMKKCPATQPSSTQSGPDTSHCQLSPAKIDVKTSDEHVMLIGHDARKRSVVLSQTCTDTETHDVCEMDYGFDLWLTTDELPGVKERTDFTRQYLTAQGLDASSLQMQGVMQQFLAPYSDSLKQLQSKAGDLKGYPLRTTFYMSIGGPMCSKAQSQSSQSSQSAQSDDASRPSGLSGLAASALGGRLSGLFGHKGGSSASTDAGSAPAASAPASTPAAPATDAGSNMVRVMSFTTETTSIDAGSIPSDQFDVPAGWTKLQPKVAKDRQFTCPTSG